MKPVRIARPVLGDLETHARAAWPREACGIMLGNAGCMLACRNLTNRALAATGFEVDPLELALCQDEAAQSGLAVAALWHSHPSGIAWPSTADRSAAAAFWPAGPGWPWLIVAIGGAGSELAAFSCTDGVLSPIPLRVSRSG